MTVVVLDRGDLSDDDVTYDELVSAIQGLEDHSLRELRKIRFLLEQLLGHPAVDPED